MHAEEDTAMSWRSCTIGVIILVCRQNSHSKFGKPECSPFNECLIFSTDWSTKGSWLSTVCRFTRQLGEHFHMVFHGSEILVKCICIYFWIIQYIFLDLILFWEKNKPPLIYKPKFSNKKTGIYQFNKVIFCYDRFFFIILLSSHLWNKWPRTIFQGGQWTTLDRNGWISKK